MADSKLRLLAGNDAPEWDEGADCALAPSRPMVRYLERERGNEIAERVVRQVGLELLDFDDKSRWVSLEQLEALLVAVREELGSDELFKVAAAYRLAEDGFGALRFLLYATTPRAVYDRSAKHASAVLAHARYEVVTSGPTSVHMRYFSERPESRLFCLLRQAQGAALPTIWRLPPAHLEETACIAHGDEACAYHIRWFVRPRWSTDVLGGILGGLLAWAVVALGTNQLSVWLVLPLLGALLGRLIETRRVNILNTGVAHDIQEALRETLREEAETRRELWALEARRSEWARMMEQAVSERTIAMRDLVERLETDLRLGTSRVKGFTHDLRGPLTVLLADATLLRDMMTDPEAVELLDGQLEAVKRIDQMLGDMVTSLPSERGLVRMRPTRIDTAEATESMRRRLRALCYGRPIRTTVFATREAPEQVVQDPVVLNRVIDNLLTNAAKYTEQGSILVEVSGRPNELTLKISDTGRGIDADVIEQVFQPEGSDPEQRAERSSGIGLSVVVQLLDQIGGRLEVMSRPGIGTTFWVHVPHEASTEAVHGAKGEEAFTRVVRIRPATGS